MPTLPDMTPIPEFCNLTLIHESSRSRIYRGAAQVDGVRVIVKELRSESYSYAEEARLRREYEILRHLHEVAGVPQARALQNDRNTLAIVLCDDGGDSLHQLLRKRALPLVDALGIAVRVAEILGAVHGAGVIHRDVNPSNIVFNPENDRVELIDYAISTLLSAENPAIGGANATGGLEGALAYISPEQTGRTNRAVDYRSDYYSLGVTLYELFSGKLPFACGDSMETVHAHLALRPTPLHEARHSIPVQLSMIVGKLMAKNAEDRYQSARGIRADLEECLRQLRESGEVAQFPLGREDVAERFIIPEKLYGRNSEIKTLMDAFQRAAGGGRALMLVEGYSGVGKSVLVREVYWPIARRRGFFISGKFDQFKRNIPYSAVVNAFQGLIRQLLTGGEKQLAEWREKLRATLGSNGRIITEVIPEVELIVGAQPELPPLAAAESEQRFRRTIFAFIHLFLAPEHPLVLFLDDLQWADSASLRLIELLMGDADTHHLFIIGAYRDNETRADHPLALAIERLEKSGEDIERVALFPLGKHHLRMLLKDTLHCDEKAVRPLADLVAAKTGGNPFFVNQFLMTLYQERLIAFSPGEDASGGKCTRWNWDLEAIKRLDFTDNVVDLMIGKLQRLPAPTQQVLRLAACVGSGFDLHTLTIIHEKSAAATFDDLLPTVYQGFVLSDAEAAFSSGGATQRFPGSGRYRFLHDRVQHAAYKLIDEGGKQAVHLRIARLLAAHLGDEESVERVFDLVGHFNKGAPLLDDDLERVKVAQLNLEAARRAKASTAYDSALRFLHEAEALLGAAVFPPQGLLLRLYRERAELEYLNGNYPEAERYFGFALAHATSVIEVAEVYGLQIVQYTMLGRHGEAISAGRRALDMLGIAMPSAGLKQAIAGELATVHEALGSRLIHTLIDAPPMTEPGMAAAMKLLNDLTPAAYFDQPEIYSWILAKMANLSLRYGHAPESGKGYTSFGNVLVYESAAFREGFEFGMLGLNLSKRNGHKAYVCRCCCVLTAFLVHWVKPLREGSALGEQGYQAGLDSGELLYAGYILAFNNVLNGFFSGRNLLEMQDEIERRRPFVEKTANRLAIDLMEAVGLAARALTGSGQTDEQAQNAAGSPTVKGIRQVLSAYLHFLFERPHEALKAARAAAVQISFINGTIAQSSHYFHLALILAACDRDFSPDEREKGREELAACCDRLQRWALSSPRNFSHQSLLARAELARVEGRRDAALELYDQAIEAAAASGFTHDEALAFELAGRFLLGESRHSFARLYLREALDGYQTWGAGAKVEQLRARYPALLLGSIRRSETQRRTISLPPGSTAHDELDLNAVLKASQAISGEIVLERLLNKLMEIVMEIAGAEKGSLILKKGERLEVEVDAAAEHDMAYPATPLEEADNIAVAIVNYVAHTCEDLVLDDASREALFARNDYVRRRALRSVLCIPILHHGQLIGLLYLENNQTTAAFTAGRVALLKTIASQAAISLENARFYMTLEESEHKYRSLYENAVEGIFRTTVAGRMLTANPAMARILGHATPEDLLSAVSDIATQLYADPEQRREIIGVLGEKSSVSDFETRFKRRDGSETWVSISARVERDEAGGIRYIEGSLLDINERKEKERAERERQEADHHLNLLKQTSGKLQTYSEWLLGRDLLGKLLADPRALTLSRQERAVLFMDVRGFTRWCDPRAPEEIATLINRYYFVAETILNRHRTIKFKLSADEVMAVFPAPQDAAAAARELRGEIAALLGEHALGAGIGIHAGPLVEGLLGSGVKFFDVIGDTVNTAKRIESAAGAGEILVSEAAAGNLATGGRREILAKGKGAPVVAYLLND